MPRRKQQKALAPIREDEELETEQNADKQKTVPEEIAELLESLHQQGRVRRYPF